MIYLAGFALLLFSFVLGINHALDRTNEGHQAPILPWWLLFSSTIPIILIVVIFIAYIYVGLYGIIQAALYVLHGVSPIEAIRNIMGEPNLYFAFPPLSPGFWVFFLSIVVGMPGSYYIGYAFALRIFFKSTISMLSLLSELLSVKIEIPKPEFKVELVKPPKILAEKNSLSNIIWPELGEKNVPKES